MRHRRNSVPKHTPVSPARPVDPAGYLNVSKNVVSEWERGVKRPGGPALRLLSIVKRKGLEAIV
jgi:hypothetical protein